MGDFKVVLSSLLEGLDFIFWILSGNARIIGDDLEKHVEKLMSAYAN